MSHDRVNCRKYHQKPWGLHPDSQKVLSAKKNGVNKTPLYFCPVLYFGV